MAARLGILGDGGWGTALALHLTRRGHRVALWGAFGPYAAQIRRTRRNPKYLPGFSLPAAVRVTADLDEALEKADGLIVAVPSQYLRSVVSRLKRARLGQCAVISVAKGIEVGTQLRMSEVIEQELGRVRLGVLSGPSIAAEVAAGKPASLVAASSKAAIAQQIQAWFMDSRMRVYTSTDVVGVELGGALKNPIAIAAGVGDGLGLGANAKAALLTRGVVEMARLGSALGARKETFWGLSGLGDLMTTCLSGRNRRLGEQLGQGKLLKAILASTAMVIEGVETSRSAVALAKRHGVELPIVEQVHAILFKRRSPHRALSLLMGRRGRAEFRSFPR